MHSEWVLHVNCKHMHTCTCGQFQHTCIWWHHKPGWPCESWVHCHCVPNVTANALYSYPLATTFRLCIDCNMPRVLILMAAVSCPLSPLHSCTHLLCTLKQTVPYPGNTVAVSKGKIYCIMTLGLINSLKYSLKNLYYTVDNSYLPPRAGLYGNASCYCMKQ